ncbi:MAG: hypothetical protein IPO40_23650 [Fibrobacteres bacterium]|nr:hypothetical protein [Fibrobacterota bacterium]
MNIFSRVLSTITSETKMPGDVRHIIKLYLIPKNQHQNTDEAIDEFLRNIEFVGSDPGGFTKRDEMTILHFLNASFVKK